MVTQTPKALPLKHLEHHAPATQQRQNVRTNPRSEAKFHTLVFFTCFVFHVFLTMPLVFSRVGVFHVLGFFTLSCFPRFKFGAKLVFHTLVPEPMKHGVKKGVENHVENNVENKQT